MRIDAHFHLWDLDRHEHAWTRESPVLHRTYRPADLRPAVAAVEGITVRPLYQPGEPMVFQHASDVPADALTASGSGLDPDISTAYAYEQVNRVATARGLSPQQVHTLVAHHVHGRDLGFLGEPRVNVLDLNRALNALSR